MRPTPGIAAVVSAKFLSGSRPEMKVSEHSTLATKPVATFGMSRARTAVAAGAPSAVVAARARISFRRVMMVSGCAVASGCHDPPSTARRFQKQPRRNRNRPRRSRKYSRNTNAYGSGGRDPGLAIFARRNAGGGLEGAVEWPERLEAGIHGDGDHGHLGLRGIGERGLGFRDPVLIEEDIEVAVTEPLVAQPPQSVFGDRMARRQRADGDVVVAI